MGIIEFLKVKKGSPASQSAELEASLERLRVELKEVNAVVENYGQARADLLLTDAADADIAKLDADHALAQIRIERLEMAEAELIDRIDAARDSSERNRRATELERAATAIESKVSAVDTAIGALGAAFADLVRAIPADSGVHIDRDHHTSAAAPAELARAILASGLFRAAPDAFEMAAPRNRSPRPACVERILGVFVVNNDGVLSRFNPGLHGEECSIRPAPEAADEIIVGPLRDQARRLRDSTELREAAE